MSNKILFSARPNDDGKKFEYLKLKIKLWKYLETNLHQNFDGSFMPTTSQCLKVTCTKQVLFEAP